LAGYVTEDNFKVNKGIVLMSCLTAPESTTDYVTALQHYSLRARVGQNAPANILHISPVIKPRHQITSRFL